MDGKRSKAEQETVSFATRRRFINWIGQVISGVSLVAIGIGLEKPGMAFAAGSVPNCNPCPPNGTCEVNYCNGNPPCSPNLRYNKMVTIYLGGCVNPGQSCPVNTCSGCAGGCDCTCPPS